MTEPGAPDFLDVNGRKIAWRREIPAEAADGRAGVMWLSGFNSSMDGAKATAVAGWARARGRSCLRFDYSGHGLSDGRLDQGTIGRWLGEACAVFDRLAAGPQILVGSSMGGWLALLLARARPAAANEGAARIAAMVLIAPATDMTERLMWANAGEDMRRAIMEDGVFLRPSAYGDGPYPITRALIEDGRNHLLLDGPIAAGWPVRILHGLEDPDVPWRHSLELVDRLDGADVTATFVKGGDHRLSTPRDIARLEAVLDELAAQVDRP